MAADIAKELRLWAVEFKPDPTMDEKVFTDAADEIVRLRKQRNEAVVEVDRLRKALERIVASKHYTQPETYGQRVAREALSKSK